MIRILIYAALAYLAYTLIRNVKLITKPRGRSVKEKDSYKNLDIKDADFEDIDEKEEK